MLLPILNAFDFQKFLTDNWMWIAGGVLAVVVIVFIIVVIVAKKKEKPNTYKSDEVDRSVDEAATRKAALSQTNEPSEQKSEQAPEAKQDNASEPKPEIKQQETNEPKQEDKSQEPLIAATEAAPKKEENPQPKQDPKPENNAEQHKPKQESKPQHSAEQHKPKQESKPQHNAEQHKPEKEEKPEADETDEEITFEAHDDADGTQEKTEKPKTISYRIMYDKETKTWEVRKDQAKRVIRRTKTKKEALEYAQELSQKQELNLVVHKKDGKFQKKH